MVGSRSLQRAGQDHRGDSSDRGDHTYRPRTRAEPYFLLIFSPTGDLRFPGGVGKTWEDGAFDRLLADVTSRIFDVYGDSAVIYPGHGEDTMLGTSVRTLGSGASAAGRPSGYWASSR